jgi:hypothetical protein
VCDVMRPFVIYTHITDEWQIEPTRWPNSGCG